MIILDTNVVLEIMRPQPAAEVMFDVARLPVGRPKQQLARSMSAMLESDFAGRVLPSDLAAASALAELQARGERAGLPLPLADAQIAADCLEHGPALATRNQKHFAGLGFAIINPWGTGAPQQSVVLRKRWLQIGRSVQRAAPATCANATT